MPQFSNQATQLGLKSENKGLNKESLGRERAAPFLLLLEEIKAFKYPAFSVLFRGSPLLLTFASSSLFDSKIVSWISELWVVKVAYNFPPPIPARFLDSLGG